VTETAVVDRSVEEVVGPYLLEGLLDPGGIGAVYHARHLELGNVCALKLIPPELARDSTSRERFLKQAVIAAGIRHPNPEAVMGNSLGW